jgi:hypothetical protein
LTTVRLCKEDFVKFQIHFGMGCLPIKIDSSSIMRVYLEVCLPIKIGVLISKEGLFLVFENHSI